MKILIQIFLLMYPLLEYWKKTMDSHLKKNRNFSPLTRKVK